MAGGQKSYPLNNPGRVHTLLWLTEWGGGRRGAGHPALRSVLGKMGSLPGSWLSSSFPCASVLSPILSQGEGGNAGHHRSHSDGAEPSKRQSELDCPKKIKKKKKKKTDLQDHLSLIPKPRKPPQLPSPS